MGFFDEVSELARRRVQARTEATAKASAAATREADNKVKARAALAEFADKMRALGITPRRIRSGTEKDGSYGYYKRIVPGRSIDVWAVPNAYQEYAFPGVYIGATAYVTENGEPYHCRDLGSQIQDTSPFTSRQVRVTEYARLDFSTWADDRSLDLLLNALRKSLET